MHAPIVDRLGAGRRLRRAPRTAIGPRTRIVHVLNDYPDLPIDTLADLVGQSRNAVERYIAPLIQTGVIERQGDIIRVTDRGAQPVS